MRGKGNFLTATDFSQGITPAYAGKSEADVQFLFHSLGSPPPMRGKAIDFSFGVVEDRITPAYAGKSQFSINIERNRRDHPRLCGEKFYRECTLEASIGSPPPMRGKDPSLILVVIGSRITPAYAGKRRKDHSGGHDK